MTQGSEAGEKVRRLEEQLHAQGSEAGEESPRGLKSNFMLKVPKLETKSVSCYISLIRNPLNSQIMLVSWRCKLSI